ncbi:hypothetical protein COCVIDRAFT_17192 [Bipolaris victoriae FI3]|uniref:Uncharacterized protein n=1 Tax=Bipolaris victoriae (strain FI3) TaxID=930091 RepID=W7E5B1_BIPV3|nr:hypothetical protein COCVIDRAFT_17192 [Bipolaris victoriae FI3]
MAQNSKAQWVPSPVRPGWIDTEPEPLAETLQAEATKLRNKLQALETRHQLLCNILVDFVKDAEIYGLNDASGLPLVQNPEEIDSLKSLQRWISQWRDAIAVFIDAPRGDNHVPETESTAPTPFEFPSST